jgi:hypothetical protein
MLYLLSDYAGRKGSRASADRTRAWTKVRESSGISKAIGVAEELTSNVTACRNEITEEALLEVRCTWRKEVKRLTSCPKQTLQDDSECLTLLALSLEQSFLPRSSKLSPNLSLCPSLTFEDVLTESPTEAAERSSRACYGLVGKTSLKRLKGREQTLQPVGRICKQPHDRSLDPNVTRAEA